MLRAVLKIVVNVASDVVTLSAIGNRVAIATIDGASVVIVAGSFVVRRGIGAADARLPSPRIVVNSACADSMGSAFTKCS